MYLFTHNSVNNKKKSIFTILLLVLQFFYSQASVGQLDNVHDINTIVTLNLKSATLDQVLTKLNSQAGFRYIYDNARAKKIVFENLNVEKIALGKLLRRLQNEAHLIYSLDGKAIIVRVESLKAKVEIKPGKITGKIVDEKGETLPGASVKVIELNSALQSHADGSYAFNLPPGTYTVEVSYISYQTKRITGVVVAEGKSTLLDVAMTPAQNALAEVVVSSSYKKASIEGLYARQKNSASATDGISTEQISRTPDNNVAQVLSRVSGLNVQENKFVTVRGLSDRYNNVTLNGSLLPSTEPNQRNFSFDVIPSGLIDNVIVYKTGTPDITGEFSGGVVEINTKDIPDENMIRIKIGSGGNSRATGNDFFQPKRGKHDFFAFDDGGRKLPSSYSPESYARAVGKNDAESKAAYRSVSAQFPNRYTLYKYTGMPVQNYEFNLGRVKQFKNNSRLGGVMALTYRNDQTSQGYIENGVPEMFAYEGDRYTFNTTIGGLLNLGYAFGKNKLAVKNVFSRKLNENAFIFDGKNTYNGADIDGYANNVLIQTVSQNRLEGEHVIGNNGFKFNWHGGFSLTRTDQPDNKSLFGDKQTGDNNVYQYVHGSDHLEHMSYYNGQLKEHRYSWSAEAQQPFTVLNQKQLLKFGYQGSYRKADFLSELFTAKSENNEFINGSLGLPYYDAYAKENFQAGNLFYLPYLANAGGGDGNNGYTGFQRLNSFYGMLDGHILPELRFIGGIRAEKNSMNTNSLLTTYEAGTGNPATKNSLIRRNDTDWLPSANLIYSLTSKFNIRGAYYHTVARPDFRELSGVQTYEPDRRTWIIGKDLKPTDIRNADLRFEFYPSPQELISVSGFYKKFKNPIELQVLSSAGDAAKEIFLIYSNLEEATDYGLEFNFRKSFDFVNSSEFFKNLYMSGNMTLIKARVKLENDEDQIIDRTLVDGTPVKFKRLAQRDRPLYGQANYIINAGLLYTGKHIGFNAVYNRTGPKIVYGAQTVEYNEWENARDVIDFQASYKFLKRNNAEVKLNLSDVLNQAVIRYYKDYKYYRQIYSGQFAEAGPDGFIAQPQKRSNAYDKEKDELRRKYNLGRNYSLSFSYTF